MHLASVTITFREQDLSSIELLLAAAILALTCVAIYSTWPRWSWEKRGR